VTVAVLAKLACSGALDPARPTVAYVTGDGLKTPEAALAHVDPVAIAADVDDVDAALGAAA
jgi:threonine synthase